MKYSMPGIVISILVLLGLILLNASLFTVQETERVILTQFGRPIGQPITAAGLHFKVPFIQDVNVFEKRVMEWDGKPNQVPTKDKVMIFVNTYARWRIHDSLRFFQRLRNEQSAHAQLDGILDSETRNAVANHVVIEIVRTDKERKPVLDESLISAGAISANWPPISIGREMIAQEIHREASRKLQDLGIELLDIRFKQINYNPEVQKKIYDRMVSERRQIADKFRSEGQGEAARIRGEKEREVKRIESEAYKQIQEIKGKADAGATEIYARAYNQSPEAYNLYLFLKTMETYQNTFDKSVMLIMSTTGDLFKFLKNSDPTPAPPAKP